VLRTATYLISMILVIVYVNACTAGKPAKRARPIAETWAAAQTQPISETRPASKPETMTPTSPPVSETRPASRPAAITPATLPTSKSATSAPATQPASEIILIRIGDRATVTQADFEAAIYGSPKGYHKRKQRSIMTFLTHRRLFDVYVEDHHLISEEELNEAIERDLKSFKIDSLEDFKQKLHTLGLTFDDHRRITRSKLAEAEMVRQGIEQGKDEAYLKELFETRREEFDGTYIEARHIMLRIAPYELPAEKEAKRKRLLQMRQDIESGKRTWEQCVAESDSSFRQGSLGGFTRHFMKNEFLVEAAFPLDIGKLSEVVETPLGYHIIQVTKRVPGTHDFEQSKKDIQRWLQQEAYIKAIAEVTRQYPVIGVRPPGEPTHLGPPPKAKMPRLKIPRRPASRSATQPAATKKAKKR